MRKVWLNVILVLPNVIMELSNIRKKKIGTVRGMVPDPLSLSLRPYGIAHDPIPIGPLVLGRTHYKAQAETKYHNGSILS